MKVPKPIFYWDRVFKINVYISYGISSDYWFKQIKKSLSYTYVDENINNIDGKHVVFLVDNTIINWIWTRQKDIATLSHECLHLVFDVMQRTNIKLNSSTEEIYCYYLDSILSLVIKKEKER